MEIKYKKTVIRQSVDGVEMETEVLLPDFGDGDEPEQTPIGIWGQRHLRYIREYKEPVFMKLLAEGKLNAYFADIDRQAKDMLFRLVKEYADRQGVTERLKADNPLEWIGRMNNIRFAVEEIINAELIYA